MISEKSLIVAASYFWVLDMMIVPLTNLTMKHYIFPQLLPQNKTKIIVLETDDFEQEGHTEMLVMLLQL